MAADRKERSLENDHTHDRALRALVAFLITFFLARGLVFLIMARRIPDLFLHVGGTHVHHLNYGIFLLSFVGAYLLFARPGERGMRIASTVYGVGLALTFDEFGMWLHLGRGYWQRASFDAVIVVAGLLGLIAVAPRLSRFRRRDGWIAAMLLATAILFGVLLFDSFRWADRQLVPKFQRLETGAPP